MIGAFASLAAAIAAFATCDPITFTAGSAAWAVLQYANSSWRASPVMTPGFSFRLDIWGQYRPVAGVAYHAVAIGAVACRDPLGAVVYREGPVGWHREVDFARTAGCAARALTGRLPVNLVFVMMAKRRSGVRTSRNKLARLAH